MSNIKVNDLVMVVKPTLCCKNPEGISDVFTVLGIERNLPTSCIYCGHESESDVAVERVDGIYRLCCDLNRLIKIDPLSEPESIPKDEEVPA